MSSVRPCPDRLLLGSGPSPVPQRVLDALAQPTIGHLDPAFGALMDEVAELLRDDVPHRRTASTFPVSAHRQRRHAGDGRQPRSRPGDRVVCGVHGLFGERMADALSRNGRRGRARSRPSGAARSRPERLVEALARAARARCSSCTARRRPASPSRSTGSPRPAREHGALLLVDCVTSLAGHPLDLDAAGVDAAFSGTQKCLNCPPGLAPFTVGDARARARCSARRSWYFDLHGVLDYWHGRRRRAPTTTPRRST